MSVNWDEPLQQALGDFDLQRVDTLKSVHVCSEFSFGRNAVTLEMCLLYDGHDVALKFLNVARLRIPEISSVGPQLADPFVDNVESEGLEGIRYRFVDEESAWLIECEDIVATVD